MDDNIYRELADLRPRDKKKLRKNRARPPVDSETAQSPAEDYAPTRLPRPAGNGSIETPPDSPLGASLTHLRNRSRSRQAQAGPAKSETAEAAASPQSRHEKRLAKSEHRQATAQASKLSRISDRREARRRRYEERRELKAQAAGQKADLKAARAAVKEQEKKRKREIADADRLVKRPWERRKLMPAGRFTRSERKRILEDIKAEAEANLEEVRERETRALLTARERLAHLQRSNEPQIDRRDLEKSLGASRLYSIRFALAASWIGLLAASWYFWQSGASSDSDLQAMLAAASAGLYALSMMRWSTMAGRAVGSTLLLAWVVMLLALMIGTANYHDSHVALLLIASFAFVFSAVLLPLFGYVVAATGTIAAFISATVTITGSTEPAELIVPTALVIGLGATIGFMVRDLRGQAVVTGSRINALNEQRALLHKREADLMQLYDVSRTIGAGESVASVLPELVARTAGYIEAKVGLVILHRKDQHTLETLSPMWVAGQTLDAEVYVFDDYGPSVASQVFQSGEPLVVNNVKPEQVAGDQLLADLGVERLAAVPLRIESNTIGVLMVADKSELFTSADIGALELLAAPAALVVEHITRYQTAQETSRRMAEVAQLKSDFVSVVSHELRTPLTSVIGALSTMARPELAPDNPTSKSLLESATLQAKKLAALIEDLLTVSKVDNQALPVEFSEIEVAPYLKTLVGSVAGWQEVQLILSSSLPTIMADTDHLQRVLTNLLDNAIKYGGGEVELTARAVGDEVWISVIDHGDGIPYEYEATVFERFTQIERADTRIKGGTGLGLNIAKDLTEAMLGRIWLEATAGGGATFICAFPRSSGDGKTRLEVGQGLLLVDPGRDRVEAPVDMDDLAGSGEGPVAE